MILIIDDDIAVRASLLLLLENAGYKAMAVSEPKESIELISTNDVSLIILDLNFSIETSGIEGIALLKQIKAINQALPVILITGWGTIELAVKGMKLGANDFVNKPWDNEYLLQSIQTLLQLQEITSEPTYLLQAAELMELAIQDFSEDETGFFFFTAAGQADVVVRKKEVYDGAVPSGNAVMAVNLFQLGTLLNRPEWKERSTKMLLGLQDVVVRYPGSFGVWAGFLMNRIHGFRELAIVGPGYQEKRDSVLSWYRPNVILQSSAKSERTFPLLFNRDSPTGGTFFYLCREYACEQPTAETQEIRDVLASVSA